VITLDISEGIFYLRYMDAIIILAKTKRHYSKIKKKLFAILRELKLTLSPKKTRVGKLKKGFHFLGINYTIDDSVDIEASRNSQSKS
jgi:hypothetical protein